MGKLGAKELLARHGTAKTDLDLWRHIYRDSYRYSQPHRDTVERSNVKGEARTDLVFDSTAPKSLAKSANRLQELTFPTGKNFVKPEPGPKFDDLEPGQKQQLQKQLDEINDAFHAAVWRSNFQAAVNPFLSDLFIGTGAMLFSEGPQWDPFHFTTVPQFAVAVCEGPWETIADVSREVKLHPAVAQQTWPKAKIPDDQKNSERTDGNKRVYVEITYGDFEDVMVGGGDVAPMPARWWYAVIDKEGGNEILSEQREFKAASPWIVARWSKSPGEIRGRGPVIQTIGHIRTANKVVEFILKNASIAIGGMWTAVDDGVFKPSTATFTTGSVIPVASNGGTRGPSIQPLEFPGDFNVSELILADYREQIKEALFDNNLPPVAGPVRTATEFVERLRELTMDIGPAAGRIQKEMLEPMYLRGLDILSRKNIINLPEGLQLDSQNIRLTVVSPLAQRQALDEIQAAMQWLELSSFFGQELVAASAEVEAIPAWLHSKLGVDTELLRDEVTKDQLLEIVGQFLAAQAAAVAEGQAPVTGTQPNGAAINGAA